MISPIGRVALAGGSKVNSLADLEVLEHADGVEDGEVRLVDGLAPPCAAAQHLLEQDARLDRPEEDDGLQPGDVDAGGEQVDRHHHARVGPVAELADSLQGSVNARGAGDLLHEVIPAPEPLPEEVTS